MAKRANLDRIKEFAKNLNSYNKQVLLQQSKVPPSQEALEMSIAKQKQESSREKAIEFARQVPRPRPRPTRRREEEGDSSCSPRRSANLRGEGVGDRDRDLHYSSKESSDLQAPSRLEELEAKHNQGKKQVEAIKKSLGL